MTVPPSVTPAQKSDDTWTVLVGTISVLALCVGAVALFFALLNADDKAPVGASSGAVITARLTEFAIEPGHLVVSTGAVIQVTNDGAATHNLTIKDEAYATSDLNAGEGATLDLAGLAPGTYTVICTVAGHEAAGMTAELMIDEGEVTGPETGAQNEVMSADEMDELMAARTARFPEETSAHGAQDLAPEVLPDGTKVFELTASVFDWQVEADKVVQAWGYNEQIPGPTIRVEVGDRVRIILHNELEESTVLHPHGFVVPNDQDGVPDITQEPIKPGESFTYEWTVHEPMVGMYHSHHNAQIQVPNGLLGAFYAGDMPLPTGTPAPAVDQPMVLNDAGVIGYSLNGKSFPATAPIVAKPGDWIKLDYMNEGMQIHPMHLHGMPQLVIAKDGYPLANPQLEDTVTIAPGERVTVVVHATEAGVWAWHCHILNHSEREDGMFGMVTALIVQ